MNTPLTVILPCFNSEGFVNKCINNLKNQTFSNFYCIFIDDGSTDNSYNNAVKAINNDSRFCIIKNQKNMGIGYTRVKGIKLADTEYITFIDIDDELSPDAIAKIVSNCAVKKADLYIYDYFESDDEWIDSMLYRADRGIENHHMGTLGIQYLDEYEDPYPVIYNKRK